MKFARDCRSSESNEATAQLLFEALPWIKNLTGKTVVIKYGGAAMVDEQLRRDVMSDIVLLKIIGMRPVIVHGGGKAINEALSHYDIPVEFKNGQRVTTPATMDIVREVLGGKVRHDDYRELVNPTGSFVLGGPAADAGLTGRKIIVDTYGGAAHHGGGAFSGKDPSKVDRSAAYATRWVAKNIVAAGLAHRVEVQVAYAIGVADPVSVNVETFGTEIGVTRDQIAAAVRKVFDLRPAAIIDELDLKRPIYEKTAAYGHFGRIDVEFPWERLNKVDALKAAIEEA